MNRKKRLCSNNLSIGVRKRFIKICSRSAALYGRETCILNKAEQKILEGFEMWCWRRVLRVCWTERRKNESILDEINEHRETRNTIKARRWNMVGHILRHESDTTL